MDVSHVVVSCLGLLLGFVLQPGAPAESCNCATVERASALGTPFVLGATCIILCLIALVILGICQLAQAANYRVQTASQSLVQWARWLISLLAT